MEKSELMNINEMKKTISNGSIDYILENLYGNDKTTLSMQKHRYLESLNSYEKLFPEQKTALFFSAPGRTEICGNHTDHNLGLVIAAAVDLDIIGAAGTSGDDRIIIKSEGHEADIIDVNSLAPKGSEKFKSAALIRGICNGFEKRGYKIGGFRAYTTSNVLKGSGLSSSAAFEVLVASMINHLFCNGEVSDVDIAKIARFSENEYFGKPCGLMDQLSCSVGGFIMIDFIDQDNPLVSKIGYDFSKMETDLVIVNTGGSHSDLNDDYAALPAEMKKVAGYFYKNVLRDLSRENVITNIKKLREITGDRAILRSFHYFDENDRVRLMYKALGEGRTDIFFQIVRKSGDSSWKLCQNCYSCNDSSAQGITLALAISSMILQDNGAFRVHGGGFAGTVQAFVPKQYTEEYINKMHAAFGDGACMKLAIRTGGNMLIDFDKMQSTIY